MSNLVIVAVPAKDDPVWKVSTEKVPHLTLLFLGEMADDDGDLGEDVNRIVEFVEHAIEVSEHGPFMMDVDYRDTLGPDDADVLFFKKNGWSSKWITQLRSQLLQQSDIKTAYDSNEQYPEWTPHLTLGYPTAPAKDDAVDYPISWITFDRIAVWTGDYEGEEFRLQWPERDNGLEVAYSDTAARGAEFVEHYGIKGMRWGVRKQEVAGGGNILVRNRNNLAAISTSSQLAVGLVGPFAFASPRVRREFGAARSHNKAVIKERKDAKKDRKWEKKIYTTDGAVRVHNAMADHFNAGIDAINNKPAYKNLNLNTHPTSELSKKYMKEVDGLTHEGYKQAVKEVHGVSPSGKKVAKYDEATQSIKIVDQSVAHAVAPEDQEQIEFLVRHDDKGKVLEMNKAELAPSAAHTVDRGRQFVMSHTSVLDDPTVRQRVQDKLKDIMEDVTGDTDGDVALFGDPIIRTKLQSVLQDLYGMGLSDAAAQAALDEGLAHYGVKGMRWGVRKEEVTSGAKRAASSTGKALVKSAKAVGRGVDNLAFEVSSSHPTVHAKIVDHATTKLVKSLPYYKKKHPVGGQFKHRMKKPFSPEARAYRKDIKKAYLGHLEKSANEITNAQGNRRYTLKENGKPNTSKYHWTVKSEPVPVKHDAVVDSDTDAVSVNVQPIYDADGYFVDVKVLGAGKPVDAPEDEEGDDAEHSLKMRVGEQFILEHYGIKGMRWGQRKEEPTAVAPHASSRVPQGAKRKTKIETQGGENHPAHEDAIKVARAQAKLKKSGAAALSNQELRDVANRVQLEKQVALLTGHKGRQFVARNLRSEGENLARAGVRTGVKTGVKRAGLAALTL